MEGQRLANLDDGRVLEADVLKSSAVHSLAAFVGVLEKEQDVVDVLCSASTGGRREKVDVDIVSRGGSRWVKVKSTSPLKLHRAFLGQSGGGDKSCLEVAEALCAARDHVAKTRSSSVGEVEVAFVFTQGLSTKLAAALESIGVVVEGGPRVHISKAGVQTLPEEDSAPSQDFARAQPPAQSPFSASSPTLATESRPPTLIPQTPSLAASHSELCSPACNPNNERLKCPPYARSKASCRAAGL